MIKKVFCFCVLTGLLSNHFFLFAQDMKNVDLSGSWYSEDPKILRNQVQNYLNKVNFPKSNKDIIGFICPHAGLDYSGETAAYGFKFLGSKNVKTVVLIGFSHKLDYDGVAVFDGEGFKTPLGVIKSNKKLFGNILSLDKKIFIKNEAFDQENSVELILPFIQVALGKTDILALAIGRQSYENSQMLAQALHVLLKGRDDIVVIASTDMSHYLPERIAVETDLATADLITDLKIRYLFTESYAKNRMCGLGPVITLMLIAEMSGFTDVKVLDMSTSAKLSGNKSKVVGYLSAAFLKSDEGEAIQEDIMEEILNKEQKEELLKLSRNTIFSYLDDKTVSNPKVTDKRLKEVMGVFVTLYKEGQLRGCIGNIIGRKPLYLGVRDMSIASATEDPRFSSVLANELDDINIEISVLSPLKRVDSAEEIILGKHGVLIKQGTRSGVYLPQVATETGWTKEEFMNSLCSGKAGIKHDAWKKGECEIYVFTAEVFGE